MRRTTLILLVISLVFIFFVFYSLLHLEPLTVSGGRLERTGGAVVVRGEVTNTASDAEAAGLKVRLFDAAGHRLAEQTLALGKLAPGQRVAFRSRPINASQAEKFTIQVDHGNNMYGN
jgi:hypothetical protein